MEKTAELEKKEKELGKIALYNKLYAEKTIDARKEELKGKMSTAMEANDFPSMTAIAKEIANLAKENESERESEKLLSIREIKKVLSSIISLIPENGIDIIVCGIRFKTKAESKSVKIDSGVTLEKNKAIEKVATIKKESLVDKVKRLSAINPSIHVTSSDKSYPKPAKAWLTKNFPEELAIS